MKYNPEHKFVEKQRNKQASKAIIDMLEKKRKL